MVKTIGKERARKLAVQALYQWLLSGTEPYEIEAQFRAIKNMEKVDIEYFSLLLQEIPKQIQTLESALVPYLDRPIKNLNAIEKIILLIGAYELYNCYDIPFKVILDQSVMLTKEFGAQDGYRYVNGVLNNLARTVRKNEING